MKFFKTLIAATLGTFLALLLGFFILLITVSSSSQEPEPFVRDHSVLEIPLSGSLPDRTTMAPLDKLLNQQSNNKVSLQTLKENLAKARVHDKIKGVLLKIDFVSAPWANLQEAHRLISAFRDSSDKFIYASTNDIGYNEKGYFLATATDSVFSPPETFFEFDGFFTQVMFLDGLFEKLGIDPEIARHGQYKGAVEPFYRKELSEENEYQLNEILKDVNAVFLSAVSEQSGHSIDELNKLLNAQPHLASGFAYEEGLIDSLMYENELKAYIKNRMGLDENDTYKIISHGRYSQVSTETAGLEQPSSSNKIAVIYAKGTILPDFGSDSPLSNREVITANFFEEQLENIRENDDVKALVIRLNSPGGAGSTSDLIWHMLRETEIPVIVSMGGVAASGGYYISMAADTIVAEPTTLTGSIGVFATKFNANELLNEELGLSFDGVKTHEHADWLSSTRGFTPAEQKAFQQYVDEFYQTFITKVATSRDISVERADELAGGRVWTGADAYENGLVDVLGGLNDAIKIAAKKANIDQYDITRFPEPKSFYELLVGSAATQAKALLNGSIFANPIADEVQSQLSILKRNGALALFPYKIEIH